MFLPLCVQAQRMNKAFMLTSPAKSLRATNQNMAHCHQSETQREGVVLDPALLQSIRVLTKIIWNGKCTRKWPMTANTEVVQDVSQ